MIYINTNYQNMNKKLLLLLGAYASWVAAALVYNKKNPSEIKSELDDARKNEDNNLKVLFNNFIEIHKNLLDDLKAKTLTDENKEIFYKKRDEILSLVEDYRQKAQEVLKEYQLKWKDYAEEWLKKLEKFYREKLEELDELKEDAPEKLEKAKEKLLAYYDEFKSKFKK